MPEIRRFIPPLLGKTLVIGGLIVLLLVPIGNVENLVGERVGMRQAAADRVRAYFTANAAAFPDHERNLAQTLERIAHCTALRAWDNGALAATAAERAK